MDIQVKENLKIALDAVSKGYTVFPCYDNKTPYCKWTKFNCTNKEDVLKWHKMSTLEDTRNKKRDKGYWAVITGPLSGLSIIDLDEYKEDFSYGDFSEDDIKYSDYINTTQSAGEHVFYAYNYELNKKYHNPCNSFGVDFLLSNSYALMYGILPAKEDLPKIPEAIVEILTKQKNNKYIKGLNNNIKSEPVIDLVTLKYILSNIKEDIGYKTGWWQIVANSATCAGTSDKAYKIINQWALD